MDKLKLDTGLVSYRIGQGTLCFNPSDPNVYARFEGVIRELGQWETQLKDTAPEQLLQTLQAMDGKLKAMLGAVFGPGNDFDRILGGVNLLAVAANGQRVITNLLQALQPVLTQGARRCAELCVAQAKAAKDPCSPV